MSLPQTTSLAFGRDQRLSGRRVFAAVFEARCRKSAGPLSVAGKPNGLSYNRLGLSTSRRVGNAVTRQLIKRRLREAFRLSQHEQPKGYDLVVTVRPHQPLAMIEYQTHLMSAIRQIETLCQKRAERQS